jgi:hypothetical protein
MVAAISIAAEGMRSSASHSEMVRQSKLGRGQKLILGVIVLVLVVVLIALGVLIRHDVTQSPLATVALSPPGTNTPRATVTVAVQPGATSLPIVPDQTLLTPTHPGTAAEILAARRIEELTRDVGQIRALPRQREIPLNFLSAQEMAAYLRRSLADVERRDLVQRQQALLAALDLLPAPDEAFPPSVQARVNHLVAFYDPVEAQIFIGPAGRDSDPPDISLVHQYAHALIDQHFSLSSLTNDSPNADAARARDALMEGDAMAVLMMQRFGEADQPGQVLDELAAHLSEAELTDYEGYFTSRAMRDVFTFPYREGTRFVAALLQAGWWPAVNTVYLDPPASTEQILHPEKYVTTPRDEPQMVRLPDLSEDLGGGWRLVGQDVLGELILRAHLDQYLPDTLEAQAAAAGWDGDLAAVWHDLDGREVLVMRTLWDSAAEADEFIRSYVTLIDRRLRGAGRVVRPILPRGGRWWRGEGGNAYLEQEGTAVLTIWAPDTDTMEQVLAVFVFGDE